jgi:hypothetical protein
MNTQKNLDLSSNLISKKYIKLSQDEQNTYSNLLTILLSQRRIPEEGLQD